MKIKQTKQKKVDPTAKKSALKSEEAMIAGILEGSPDGIAVAVIRLECGCRKMAAVDKDGEPASKVIIYRDQANEICSKCKDDNGAFNRVTESFLDWVDPAPEPDKMKEIEIKVLGDMPPVH
jgi:hypothetical protein